MKSPACTFKCHPVLFLLLVLLLVRLEPVEVYAQKKEMKGYGAASYRVAQKGTYMRSWLLAGPLFVKEGHAGEVDAETQEAAFYKDILSSVAVEANKPAPALQHGGKTVPWQVYSAAADLVDLDAVFDQKDYAFGYALAEIRSDSSCTAFLAVGSDDGVMVWHNGRLVHKNWTARPVEPDSDLVPLNLVKGSNQVLIKIQDINGGWGFMARLLDRAALSQRLIVTAGRGDLDEANLLLSAGADVGAKDRAGLTALHRARLAGRAEVEALLIEKGAVSSPLPPAEKMLDEMYSPLSQKPSPGVAVLVAQHGEILYQEGFGFADIEGKVPVTPDTRFRIGSVTKQFTASAILKLQEEGRLRVTDRLSKYMPGFPRGDEVTIHHLLTHTSGIHSYTGKPDFMTRVTGPVTPQELVDYFKDDPYDFDPGEEYRYNNSAYFLLGCIIEKVSGQTYAAYLKRQFFDPLKMENTGVHTPELNLAHEAKGYAPAGGGGYEHAPDWNMVWAGGAGALYSTVGDLYKWNEALFGGRVLNGQSMKAAFTPVLLNNGQPPANTKYGYGWQLDRYRGRPVIHHGGGLHGFISQLARYPEEELTIVVLNNVSPPVINPDQNKIGEYFLWEKMDGQPSFSQAGTPRQDLAVYAGRYDFSNGMVMTVTEKEGGLFAQLSGQPAFPIYPSGEDAFHWKVVEARIRFFKNEKGEVTHGLFYQNGNEINVKKLEEKKAMAVDPAMLKDYVGRYNFINGTTLTFTADDKNLYAQVTGQAAYPVFPSAADEFFWKVVEASIKFVRDENGRVLYGLFKQGGSEIKAEKEE